MKEDTNEIERLKAEAARLAEENSAIRRLANKYLAEVSSKDKQFEDYVRRMADDITSMSAEADDQIAALKAEVESLRAALKQINVGEGWAAQIARAALTNNFNIKENEHG
jgi:uncharacterized small protein (DUF1192 family)